MAYSRVDKPVIKIKRVNAMPLIGGAGTIQELGYIYKWESSFYWITTAELQAAIDIDVAAGWTLEGDPNRSRVHEAIADLFNAEVAYFKYSATY